MIRLRSSAAAAAAALALASAGPTAASVRSRDLSAFGGPVLRGATKVAPAGDVNGDGVPDVLASKGDYFTEPTEGVVYVVFGSASLGDVDLDELGDGGFVIRGASEEDEASYTASAGDVNGDGLGDVIVGAPGAEPAETGVGPPVDTHLRSEGGRVYVVFGKATTEAVDLAAYDTGTQGDTGFRIDGPSNGTAAGRAVDGAGDVNGDGLHDVVLAAPGGAVAYVVFGQTHGGAVDLATVGAEAEPARGFAIATPWPNGEDRMSVSDPVTSTATGCPMS
ncbi:MAG TPA: integrin alpha [Actinomycetota bacterium]|nr:integrin alpha [Actinomycetota bacterium]